MTYVRNLSRLQAARQHALKRLYERYGLAITNADLRTITARIAAGGFPTVGKGLAGGTVYRVTIRNVEALAVYSRSQDCIMTFLPKGALVRQEAAE